ncbi:hypothetical protein JTE90_005367 [Oedothorax gibbosus]|uniref:Uncharacterized protein n=1 Tax=Oedothorax gibbosus TaxID=931172 RepID=A0AAV6TL91_9ARAC|nr:hypothetical protein JTE90_005367 [Oedothorax gibbosus]
MSNQSPKAYTPPRRGHTGPVRSLIAGLTTIKSTHNNLTNRPEARYRDPYMSNQSPKAYSTSERAHGPCTFSHRWVDHHQINP